MVKAWEHLSHKKRKVIKNEQHRSIEPSAQARCVRFCSCLCKVWSHVSEALLLTLETLFLSLVTITVLQTVRFVVFSGSPTAVHRAFLFFDTKACPQSQTDLFTCTTVLHWGHTFLRCIDLIYGIALWAPHSEPLVKDRHLLKFDGKIPKYCVLQVTWSHTHRMCYREVYGNIAHAQNGWHSRGLPVSL